MEVSFLHSRSWRELSALPRGGAVLFLLIGLVFLATGVGLTLEHVRFKQKAIRSTGTVVELVPRQGSEGGQLWAPVIRFYDPGSGEEIEFTSRIASSPPAYAIGGVVVVLHPPGQPHLARADGFMEWLLDLVFVVLGAVFSSIGFLALYLHVRARQAPVPATTVVS
jgi:hypothetical protein